MEKNDLWLYVKIGRYYGYIKFELNVDCHQYAIHMGNNIIFDDISLYKKNDFEQRRLSALYII